MEMKLSVPDTLREPIRYDAERRRLWVLGQRCHHGATGAVLAAAAGAVIARARLIDSARATLDGARAASHALTHAGALAAFGGLLMLHDWKDHSIWFEFGAGRQP